MGFLSHHGRIVQQIERVVSIGGTERDGIVGAVRLGQSIEILEKQLSRLVIQIAQLGRSAQAGRAAPASRTSPHRRPRGRACCAARASRVSAVRGLGPSQGGCPDRPLCPPLAPSVHLVSAGTDGRLRRVRYRARRYGYASTPLSVAGVLAGSGGLYLWFTQPSSAASERALVIGARGAF
jgi:hypothetical protein